MLDDLVYSLFYYLSLPFQIELVSFFEITIMWTELSPFPCEVAESVTLGMQVQGTWFAFPCTDIFVGQRDR